MDSPLPDGRQSLISQGRLATGSSIKSGSHLFNLRGVLGICPWVSWYLIKLYPGQFALNIRGLRGGWEEKSSHYLSRESDFSESGKKGSRLITLFTLSRASDPTSMATGNKGKWGRRGKSRDHRPLNPGLVILWKQEGGLSEL